MTIDQLLAEVEPVAWRYRYLDGGKWNVQKNKPNWYRDFMPDVELEPLFSAATFTAEREAREKAEAERDAALSDETFEAKYRATYNFSLNKPGYWYNLASILSNRVMEMDKRSRAANRRADAAESRVKEAEAVISPFVTDWADEHGWTENACQNDRVVDWFGPSDFRAAAKFMEAKDGNQ